MRNFTRFVRAILLALFVLTLVMGQPTQLRAEGTPSGTGKTMTAVLLGKSSATVTPAE
jgi:hypothetical protein